MTNQVKIEDTFAEAFPMRGTRLVITAADAELAGIAAGEGRAGSEIVLVGIGAAQQGRNE